MGSDAGITEDKFENVYSNFKCMGLNSSINFLKLYNKFADGILEVFLYILCAYIYKYVYLNINVCLYM
jgi:hypothetical protein